MDTIHTIGRRKASVARIYMSTGKGNITINKKESKDYFSTDTLLYKMPTSRSVDIDSLLDFEIVEYLLLNKKILKK